MKHFLSTLAVVATTVVIPAFAQQKSGDMKGMDMGAKPAAAAHHDAKGTVKSVDKKGHTVTLAHGPVASLNWPAMTMKFGVKDPKAMDKFKAGQEVEVEFVQKGKDYVITKVK